MKFKTLLKINKQSIILVLLCIGINGYSQINFEKGYFVNNLGEKTNCLIKNVDWKNNPTQFEYKVDESSESKIARIASVREFGIFEKSKYQRFDVEIDKSEEKLRYLSWNRDPEYKTETLFLKLLVEGKANLYQYDNQNVKKFFFKTDSTIIKQLVYKTYRINEIDTDKNNLYRQQLWTNLKCKDISIARIENLKYFKRELVKLFTDYNNCSNSKTTVFGVKETKNLLSLSIRPGIRYSSLNIRNRTSSDRNTRFDDQLTYRIGLEAEFILPFNNDKWGVLLEPTYQQYKSTGIAELAETKVDYKSIELPFGIRHYFLVKKNSKLYANLAYVFDITLNSKIPFPEFDNDLATRRSLELNGGRNIALGLGYKFKNKYSLEINYQPDREVLTNSGISWRSNYSSISAIFGYKIF